MAEPLKNMYNPTFFERLCPVLKKAIPGFKQQQFINCVFDSSWPDLELKQRVRHITKALHTFLPAHFPTASILIIEIAKQIKEKAIREQGFEFIFLGDYIEVYGVDHFEESVIAMEEVTKLVSAEFAVRPFLIRYPEAMMDKMLQWSKQENANVRRLSSEGCRPNLPWAMGVPYLKKNPKSILALLENLKNDPSEYVRRSVANNLNDIAKHHPQLILSLAKKWYGKSEATNAIIKHGCRTLLKKGDPAALMLHGYNPNGKATVSNLVLEKDKIKIGHTLHFNFTFKSAEKKKVNFRLEYMVDYLTLTGKTSCKVFKITEGVFNPQETVHFSKKQSFKDFTTRKHYKGKHTIAIIVNGKKQIAKEFMIC